MLVTRVCNFVVYAVEYFSAVFAINSLYASLGYPPLPGWIPNGGDPCLEAWQGIECVNSNITGMYGDHFQIVIDVLQ